MMYTLEGVGKVRWSIKKWYIPIDSFVPLFIINFRHCKFHFSSIALHTWVACQPYCMFAVGAKPFQVSQDVKDGCFHCVFKKSVFLPAVYNLSILEAWASVALTTIKSYHWQRTRPSCTYVPTYVSSTSSVMHSLMCVLLCSILGIGCVIELCCYRTLTREKIYIICVK